LILIALPVMALTAAGFTIRSAMASPEEQATGTLGSADMTVNSYPETLTTEKLVAAFPAGTRVSFSRYVDVTRIVDGKTWYTRFLETSVPADRLPVGPR